MLFILAPASFFVTFPVMVVVYLLQYKAKAVSREVYKWKLITDKGIDAQVQETFKGLQLVRACSKQKAMSEEFLNKLNDSINTRSVL